MSSKTIQLIVLLVLVSFAVIAATGPVSATPAALNSTSPHSNANASSYLPQDTTPIGYVQVDLSRQGGANDNMMGDFVDDVVYNYLNTDADPTNDVELFFNNAASLRTDWCWNGAAWVNTSSACTAGLHAAEPLSSDQLTATLPVTLTTVVGNLTGAQIMQVLNQAPRTSNGVIQPVGLKYKYYAYRDANPGPQPFAWGPFDIQVLDHSTHTWGALNLTKTYKVGTNGTLAPGGGDGYTGFRSITGTVTVGSTLSEVSAYVAAHYGDAAHAYAGPNGDGTLDGRILRDGNDTLGSGSIIPITVLHNNDSHGNLTGTRSYPRLATLVKQERLHNPSRTLLLNAGDQIQGDSMMYYFKSAPLGAAADGTPLPTNLQIQPIIALMNSMNYDAMTLGNHEFNFGSVTFGSIFKQATFPLLAANISDDGRFGLAHVGPGGQGVQPYLLKTVGPENIKVAIIGIGNHRVPSYELPSNIVGLTFSNPLTTAQQYSDQLRPSNDVVLALTHIGYTLNTSSVEVDDKVDTVMAAQVSGLDAIVGGHSHTTLTIPTMIGGPSNVPVLVTQAGSANSILGELIIGVRAKPGGGYEVVSRTGQYLSNGSSIPEDPASAAIIAPYTAILNTYNARILGQTTVPINTQAAYTAETNGANLQADASMYELGQHGITPDFHLSGAMTSASVASGASASNPYTLTVANMFTLMPYENSLVTMRMNGPQIKAVLERSYRNFYYYKYVQGRGGYDYYTTCMLDTNSGNQILYKDLNPTLPNGNNVLAFSFNGKRIDFADATKYYLVSTVNYLAAGACNMTDNGSTIWPLNQIVNDTQYYVRDATIDYITNKSLVSPAIEGRISFAMNINGQVYNDLNGNGAQSAGENGVSGWTVQLINATKSTVLATRTTDASGNYSFTDLGYGPYQVRLALQSGYLQTTANPAKINGGNNVNSNGVNFGVVKPNDIQVAVVQTTGNQWAGTPMTYTINLYNNGPAAAQHMTLTDVVPAHTTFAAVTPPNGWTCTTPAVGATGTVSCTTASMSQGKTSMTLTVLVDTDVVNATKLADTAVVASDVLDTNPANNGYTVSRMIYNQSDVSIQQVADMIGSGQVQYSFTIQNAGPNTAKSVILTDALAATTSALSFTASQGTCVLGPKVTCTLGDVAVGSTVTVQIVVTVTGHPASIINTGKLTTATVDPHPADKAATAVVTGPF